jgi:hypothetical protein
VSVPGSVCCESAGGSGWGLNPREIPAKQNRKNTAALRMDVLFKLLIFYPPRVVILSVAKNDHIISVSVFSDTFSS